MSNPVPYLGSKNEIFKNNEMIKKKLCGKQWFMIDKKIYDWIKDIPKDSKILDIGCGAGWVAKILLEEGFYNIGLIDRDNYITIPEVERLARFNQADLNFEKLPYQDRSVDVIFATQVLEHLENPWHFARECARVLRGGGRLTITVPHSHNIYSRMSFLKSCEIERFTLENDHIAFLTKSCFAKCFLKNFSIKKIDYSKPLLKFLRFKRPLPSTDFFNKYFSANICFILEKKS